MGPLLDALYEHCKKKVTEVVNFKNPDSLVTMSMGGWKAPTGEHICNYMWVTDEVCVCVCVYHSAILFLSSVAAPFSQYTFFFRATNAGTTRPTGEHIGRVPCKMIEATGAANVAGVASDNASAETTSWDVIREYAAPPLPHTHTSVRHCPSTPSLRPSAPQ